MAGSEHKDSLSSSIVIIATMSLSFTESAIDGSPLKITHKRLPIHEQSSPSDSVQAFIKVPRCSNNLHDEKIIQVINQMKIM